MMVMVTCGSKISFMVGRETSFLVLEPADFGRRGAEASASANDAR